MANNYLTLVLITYMVFGNKSIKFHVNSHHIRHSNHHNHQTAAVHSNGQNGEYNGGGQHVPNLWTILDKHSRFVENNYPTTILNKNGSFPSESAAQRAQSDHNFQVKRHRFDKDNKNSNQNTDDDESDQYYTRNERISSPASKLKDSETSVTKNNNVKCPKCSGTTNVRVSEEQLIELRIEFVKNQILQKLRLKERPQVTVSELPRPIYEGVAIHGDEKAQSKDLDDYYARTSQKFIFLEQERTECDRVNQYPSICFSFKIDGDIDSMDVSTAELWLYKRSSLGDIDHKHALVVSELDQAAVKGNGKNYLPKSKPIAIQSTGAEAGWIKIDIAWPIKKWFGNHELSHIIQISCPSCEQDVDENMLSTEKDYRPFILIDTLNRRNIRRQKRNVNCSAGVTECCREKLYISFAEIGWNDWILHPAGYDAYFCRGSCSTAASITMSNSHYSTVLRKVIYQRESGGNPLELIPCCTAKQFSSLQLIYLDSNKTGTVKTLPNMVVESCGCM